MEFKQKFEDYLENKKLEDELNFYLIKMYWFSIEYIIPAISYSMKSSKFIAIASSQYIGATEMHSWIFLELRFFSSHSKWL